MTRTQIGILAASVLAALIALAAIALLWPRSPPPPEKLVIAVADSLLGVPLWVAQGQGFFAAEGLDVNLVRYPTGKPALDALLRGEAQVATVAETPIMFAGLARQPIRVLANYDSRLTRLHPEAVTLIRRP
jgi:ABC-type nitrate/sulfonate/bicarbonate transport system substrate-binding protein